MNGITPVPFPFAKPKEPEQVGVATGDIWLQLPDRDPTVKDEFKKAEMPLMPVTSVKEIKPARTGPLVARSVLLAPLTPALAVPKVPLVLTLNVNALLVTEDAFVMEAVARSLNGESEAEQDVGPLCIDVTPLGEVTMHAVLLITAATPGIERNTHAKETANVFMEGTLGYGAEPVTGIQ